MEPVSRHRCQSDEVMGIRAQYFGFDRHSVAPQRLFSQIAAHFGWPRAWSKEQLVFEFKFCGLVPLCAAVGKAGKAKLSILLCICVKLMEGHLQRQESALAH